MSLMWLHSSSHAVCVNGVTLQPVAGVRVFDAFPEASPVP